MMFLLLQNIGTGSADHAVKMAYRQSAWTHLMTSCRSSSNTRTSQDPLLRHKEQTWVLKERICGPECPSLVNMSGMYKANFQNRGSDLAAYHPFFLESVPTQCEQT